MSEKVKVLVLIIYLVAGTAFGGERSSRSKGTQILKAAPPAMCIKQLSKIVTDTAKIMGFKDPIGVHWADPVKKGTNSRGEQIFEYATGVFILSEGFLQDSGAKASVIGNEGSCKVLKIEVSVGSQ